MLSTLAHPAFERLDQWSGQAPPIDPDALIASLDRARGGRPPDPRFGDPEAPLRTWVQGIPEDQRGGALRQRLLLQQLHGLSRSRDRLERALQAHPEVEQAPLPAPVFVVGLPRSGTTLLHQLLSLQPGWRAPRFWELIHPVAPRLDLRRARTAAQLRFADWLIPTMSTVHALQADSPEECPVGYTPTLCTVQMDHRARSPDYQRWWLASDMRPAYRYYRALLQWLQQGQPTRWVLKAPEHLFHLDALADVFPDARLVVLRRDPLQVAPSACSLLWHTRHFLSRPGRPEGLGPEWLSLWSVAQARLRAFSARPRLPLVQVDYADLVADPRATAIRIWAELQVEAQPGPLAAWQASRAHRPAHRYSLETFGLSRAQISAALDPGRPLAA